MSKPLEVCRLLLVEDNPADADLVREYLDQIEGARFATQCVSTLAQALLALGAGADMALLDLRLPDSSGVQGVEAMRAASEATPVIVLTGIEDEALAESCLDAGAQDYLCKSEINAATLRRAIRYSITRHRETQERLKLQRELEEALAKVLGGFIPICSHCKRIREGEEWNRIEAYFQNHSAATFSHTVCPSCLREHYPEMAGKLAAKNLIP